MNSKISKEELYQLPVKGFEGRIYVVETAEQVEEACQILKKHKIIGFDTETRPSFKKGVKHQVALLQLSTYNEAFLFRINRIGLPRPVVEILSDITIEKVGVAIKDDISALKAIHRFREAGFIEIQSIAKEKGFENLGLKNLSGLLLNFRISKSQQTSNWENPILTEPQRVYAATDAWVSLKIYDEILKVTEVISVEEPVIIQNE